TSFGEDKQISAAIQAGALGYLLKDSSPDDLFHAIRNVHRGKMVLSQDMAVKLVQSSPTHSELEQLTEREFDVLKLVAQGQTNAEIAESLSIGVTTVRTHVGRLLSKLGYSNRTQLALFAAEQNLHSPL
ncbi:MAG: response regulator transcription factor, partial [Caldilineaceae bacterium]|nr:response regulator transcription factor [Caldilineaceae bacterium]